MFLCEKLSARAALIVIPLVDYYADQAPHLEWMFVDTAASVIDIT
jgi:hypothetical protein